MKAPRVAAERAVLLASGGALIAFMYFPVLALAFSTSLHDVQTGLSAASVWPAVKLSALTTGFSVGLVVLTGTPLAWVISQSQRKSVRVLEAFLQLPAVMPPAVAGVALLIAFGRRGWLSTNVFGDAWSLSLSTTAVVLAQTFVAAPFFLQAAMAAFRRIDSGLLLVARSLGAHPLTVFAHIAVPIAAPGLIAGGLMCWARALGEFGATLMFAGNLEGTTQTLPLAIYAALEGDWTAARALSLLLMGLAFSLLLLIKALQPRWEPEAT